LSNFSRAASHSSRDLILCFAIAYPHPSALTCRAVVSTKEEPSTINSQPALVSTSSLRAPKEYFQPDL
jgi:hypothetical protein